MWLACVCVGFASGGCSGGDLDLVGISFSESNRLIVSLDWGE